MNWVKKNLAIIVATLIGLAAFVFKAFLGSKREQEERTKPVLDAVDAMEDSKADDVKEVEKLSEQRDNHAEKAAEISKESRAGLKKKSKSMDEAKSRW